VAEARPAVIDRLPTLTEVIELQHGLDDEGPATLAFEPDERELLYLAHRAPPAPPPAAPALPPATELTAEVLFELNQRIDSLFEARLREALAPALARAAEGLIRDARDELAGLLETLVHDAVTRALERHTHL
jgi:hypothetical protein